MKKCLFLFAVCYAVHTHAQITTDPGTSKELKQAMPCSGELNAVTAVSLGKERRSAVVFNHNGGVFDPSPLLSASVNVKEGSCVIIHFSAHTYVADNSVVYQMRMDGKPVEDHSTTMIPNGGTAVQPVIIVADEDGHATKAYHPVSYTFFAKAAPGNHKIEVMTAVCCSANAGGSPVVVADNATLTIQFNK